MTKKIMIEVDEEVYEKFLLALTLTKEETSQVCESLMKNYISDCFGQAIKELNPSKPVRKVNTSPQFFMGKQS